MRLNMWMIANRLEGLDYQTSLHTRTPSVLHSARLVYAPDCVQLSQEGNDVLCAFGEEYIRIRDIDLKYAFELIQGIFDSYDDWYTRSVLYAKDNNWQAAVDDLGYLLKNPVVFFDANNRVMAMSSTYLDGAVDEEWDYLKKHGFSSSKMMRIGRKNVEVVDKWQIQVQKRPPSNMKCGVITSKIESGGKTYGYISALEMDRKFNDGDIKLLMVLTELLTPAFAFYCNTTMEQSSSNCFRELLLEEKTDPTSLELQMTYFGMREKDRYRVEVIRMQTEEIDIHMLKKHILLNGIPMPVMIIGDHIAVIVDLDNGADKNLAALLQELSKEERFQLGRSAVCDCLTDIWAYYRQALFSLNYPPDEENYVHLFERHAVDFIIQNADKKKLICACHAGVRALFMQKNTLSEDGLNSLEMYLKFERSLSKAAKELFIHKNTLLYRIQKTEDLCGCDLSDPEVREYVLLSIRTLRLLLK